MTAPVPNRTGGSILRPSSPRSGVIGAVLLFLGLALLSGLATAPFRSADETPHVAYAIAVGHGHIPHRDQPVPPEIPGEHETTIYTANHPPLYYALEAVPLRLGIDSGHPLAGLHVARAESALFSAGTVLLTAVLAGALLGTARPEVTVTAAAVMATWGSFVYTSSFVYNDSLATLMSVAVLLGALGVLRAGLRPGRCVLLALAAAAALAARASNGEVVAVAAVGLAVAGAVHHRRRWIGLARALGWAGLGAVVCAAAIGWFYLLNADRYGDPVGRIAQESGAPSPVWALQHYPYPEHMLGFVFSPHTYTQLARQAYGDLLGVSRVLTWSGAVITVGLVIVWGLVALGLAWWLRRCPALRPARRSQAVIGLAVLHCLASLVYVFWWVRSGNYPHLRYLFPILPVVAVFIARMVSGLPGGRAFAAIVVTVQSGLSLIYLAIMPSQWTGEDIWHAYSAGIAKAGIPGPSLVCALLVAMVAIGWLLTVHSVLTVRAPSANPGRHRTADRPPVVQEPVTP